MQCVQMERQDQSMLKITYRSNTQILVVEFFKMASVHVKSAIHMEGWNIALHCVTAFVLNREYELQKWVDRAYFLKWGPYCNVIHISSRITNPLTNRVTVSPPHPGVLCVSYCISPAIESHSGAMIPKYKQQSLLLLAEIISSSCCDLTYKNLWFTAAPWTIIPSQPIPSFKGWQKKSISQYLYNLSNHLIEQNRPSWSLQWAADIFKNGTWSHPFLWVHPHTTYSPATVRV